MIVKGKDVVLSFNDAGDMKPFCCARSASLSLTADLAETSTQGTGKWKTYRGMKLSYSLNCSGLVSFDMNMSLARLRNIQISLQTINFSFIATDNAGLQEIYSGSVIVSQTDSPTSYDGNFEYSMSGQGVGPLTVETFAPSPAANIYYGVQNTNSDPDSFANFITGDPGADILISYGAQTQPKFYWMANVDTVPIKTKWLDANNLLNQGTIGASDDLFEVRTIVINSINYTLYMTRYATGFNNPAQIKYFT